MQLQPGHPLDEISIASITRDLLHAVEYLHTEGKIHRDIKGFLCLYILLLYDFSVIQLCSHCLLHDNFSFLFLQPLIFCWRRMVTLRYSILHSLSSSVTFISEWFSSKTDFQRLSHVSGCGLWCVCPINPDNIKEEGVYLNMLMDLLYCVYCSRNQNSLK